MFVLCLAIILCATLLSLANSENVQHLSFQANTGSYDLTPLEKIFHKDVVNNIVHIDFKAVNDKLIKVQLEKNQAIILTDAVSDLSANSVYELDLAPYGKGNYTITLITSQQKVITEQFDVP